MPAVSYCCRRWWRLAAATPHLKEEIAPPRPLPLGQISHFFNVVLPFTGEIELKEETVECLLSTSCLLQLSEVVEACCGFLMKQLHPSNCIGIRQFADAQGCSDLYKVANNYVMVSSYIGCFLPVLSGFIWLKPLSRKKLVLLAG